VTAANGSALGAVAGADSVVMRVTAELGSDVGVTEDEELTAALGAGT
jgi:hypothetical protein